MFLCVRIIDFAAMVPEGDTEFMLGLIIEECK